LKYCDELYLHVNIKSIIVSLINQIATYAHYRAAEGKPVSLPLFDIFLDKISEIVKVSSSVSCCSSDCDYVYKTWITTIM